MKNLKDIERILKELQIGASNYLVKINVTKELEEGRTETQVNINTVANSKYAVSTAIDMACFSNSDFEQFAQIGSGTVNIFNVSKFQMDKNGLSIRAKSSYKKNNVLISVDILPKKE